MGNIVFDIATDNEGMFFQISVNVTGIEIPEELRQFGAINDAGEEWLLHMPLAIQKNARLIAAAPAMLAALKECAKQLRFLDCHGHAAVAQSAIDMAEEG